MPSAKKTTAKARAKAKTPVKTKAAPAKAKAPTKGKAPAQGAIPPLGELGEKQLRALATKIAKCKDPDQIADKLRDAYDGCVGEVLWHLVTHGLVGASTSPAMLQQMGNEADFAPPEALVPTLASIRSWGEEHFPKWLDGFAVEALSQCEPALMAARPSLARDVKLTVDFVLARAGRPLTAAEGSTLAYALGKRHAHERGLRDAAGAQVKPDGKTIPWSPDDPTLEALVDLLGDRDAWDKGLLAGARASTFETLSQVSSGLLLSDLKACVAIIAKAPLSNSHDDVPKLLALLERRKDRTEELIAAIEAQTEGEENPLEWLRLAAMARAGAAGVALPQGFEAKLSFEIWRRIEAPFNAQKRALLALYAAAITALGRERSLVLARKRFQEKDFETVARLLGIHFDEELFDRLATEGWANALAFYQADPVVIPRLLARAEATQDPSKKYNTWRAAAFGAAAGACGRGVPWRPEWVAFLDFNDGGEYLSEPWPTFWPMIAAAMPIAESIPLLDAALTQAKHVDRPFRAAVAIRDRGLRSRAVRALIQRRKTIGSPYFSAALRMLGKDLLPLFAEHLHLAKGDRDFMKILSDEFGQAGVDWTDAYALLKRERETWLDQLKRLVKGAKGADGGTERIYVLQFADGEVELETPKGSWSKLGGTPPGVPVPAHKGAAMHHVLTLDLEEVPELAPRFPGARALSFFVPNARKGDHYDQSQLLAVPAAATPPTGRDLAVIGFDVPSAVFDRKRATGALGELRKTIFNQPGWVLGKPMWIQGDEGEPNFVMQLNEDFGLNLGDAGTLVVGARGATMQCL